jgi:predicted CoA-binding protein
MLLHDVSGVRKGQSCHPRFARATWPLAPSRALSIHEPIEDDEAETLRGVLSASTDPENPGARELRDVLERARRIAVVGLSRFPEKPSLRVPAYFVSRGYEVVPVNPNAERVLGRQAYPKLADVPGDVDLVMIFRPSDQAGAFVHEALARPERPAIWLSEGIRADAAVADARSRGVTAIQDLCPYKVHSRLGISPRELFSPSRRDPSR